jgi:hypothetical protein
MNANPNKDKRCALCKRWQGDTASALSKGSSPGLVKINAGKSGKCLVFGSSKSAQETGCNKFELSPEADRYRL